MAPDVSKHQDTIILIDTPYPHFIDRMDSQKWGHWPLNFGTWMAMASVCSVQFELFYIPISKALSAKSLCPGSQEVVLSNVLNSC